MAHHHDPREPGLGIALIIAMLAILVLSVLAASIIYVTQSQTWTALNYRLTTQCRYGAEAGLQQTMNWLVNTYVPPSIPFSGSYDISKYPVQYNGQAVVLSAVSGVASNYPDATQQTAFNNALSNRPIIGIANETFSTYATLLSMRPVTAAFTGAPFAIQIWQITSQGSITGVRNAQVQVIATFEKQTPPVFPYALFATGTGCGSITVSDNGETDSFDSRLGAYPAGFLDAQGNVGTNGNLNISDAGTTLHGSLSSPNGNTTGACPPSNSLTASGGASVTQGITALSQPVIYPNPPAPSPIPPTTVQNISGTCGAVPGCTDIGPGNVRLAPGQYGNLNFSAGTKVDLTAGTYNVNSLVVADGSPVIVNVVSGPVFFNLAGVGVAAAINLAGGSISNAGSPGNFQIIYGGTDTIILSGSSGSSAVVYAPNAPVNFTGASPWVGAVIGSTVTNNVGLHVHYDRALANSPQTVGTYHPISFSWSKF